MVFEDDATLVAVYHRSAACCVRILPTPRICGWPQSHFRAGWLAASHPIKRDVKRNILPFPRREQEFGRLDPASALATRVFGVDRLKRAAEGRVQAEPMVPTRLFHDTVALDAVQFLTLRKLEVLARR